MIFKSPSPGSSKNSAIAEIKLTKLERNKNIYLILFSVLTAGVVFSLTTPYMAVATFAYGLMVSGVIQRKKNLIHLRFMFTAILLDLILVLSLELQRSAVGTAMAMKLNPYQQLHIYFSSLAVLFYFPTIYLAMKIYRLRQIGQDVRGKIWHIRLGIIAFILRTFGFLLMFSLLDQPKP